MANRYGRFDDAAREYVVTRPDTPLPWLNYLGQDELFGLCTNTGGGYTFWRDARLRRLTRYRYNDVPLDSVGRYLYVNDGGTVWNPGWKPTKTAARPLRVPARPRLHTDRRRKGRRRGRDALLRAAGRERRDLEDDRPERRRGGQGSEAVLVRRVLPLRGLQRRDELPAVVRKRRGGGRRVGDLPRERVPRAAQPLHAVRLHTGGERLRHVPRRVCGRALRAARGGRPVRGPGAGEHRARLEPDRLASARPPARARLRGDLRVRPRLRRAGRGEEVREPLRREQGAGAAAAGALLRARRGRLGVPGAPGEVGRPALDLPGRLPRAERDSGCSTRGTSTSAWRRSTCLGRQASTRRGSDAGWGSATPTRTCSASCT